MNLTGRCIEFITLKTKNKTGNIRRILRVLKPAASGRYFSTGPIFDFEIQDTSRFIDTAPEACVGSIIEVKTNNPKNVQHKKTPVVKSVALLTPNRNRGQLNLSLRNIQNPDRQKKLRIRSATTRAIHKFFTKQDYQHVETPALVKSPGMEPHIRPFQTSSGAFLHTSPEFAMKKLLVEGFEKIYQISKTYRYEPPSHTHHPEFTMLEWYEAYKDLAGLRAQTEALVKFVAREIYKTEHKKDLPHLFKKPFLVKTVKQLFLEGTGFLLPTQDDVEKLRKIERSLKIPGKREHDQRSWDDVFFSIWLNAVEPKFPRDRGLFVTEFPESQAALSTLKQDLDKTWVANRFELYLGGVELANAFHELTDPERQLQRFIKDQKIRKLNYGTLYPESPIDEEFIEALREGLPPSSGIALGVDRLVMILAEAQTLEETLWLPAFHPTE